MVLETIVLPLHHTHIFAAHSFAVKSPRKFYSLGNSVLNLSLTAILLLPRSYPGLPCRVGTRFSTLEILGKGRKPQERHKRFELLPSAWKAVMLPLTPVTLMPAPTIVHFTTEPKRGVTYC